jgi:hypothetical protein
LCFRFDIVDITRRDLRFEALKPDFAKKDIKVYKIDIWREIFETVLKIGFYDAWHLWSPSQNLDSVKGGGGRGANSREKCLLCVGNIPGKMTSPLPPPPP